MSKRIGLAVVTITNGVGGGLCIFSESVGAIGNRNNNTKLKNINLLVED